LIFLFLQGFVAHRAEKPLFAGFYFALIVLTKPYWIMLVLPFLLAKEWKLIAYSLLHILILIGLSFFIGGFEDSWNLYNEWIQAMLAHSSYLTSTHTWFGLAEAFFSIQDLERFSIPVFAFVSVFLALIFYFSIDLKKRDNQFLLASLLLAMTPNFLITDTEHFLYSIPILIYLFTRFQDFVLSLKIALVLGLLAYAFNPLPQFGSLGIGNLALLTIFTILLLKNQFPTKN
jgi:hypothetical protein